MTGNVGCFFLLLAVALACFLQVWPRWARNVAQHRSQTDICVAKSFAVPVVELPDTCSAKGSRVPHPRGPSVAALTALNITGWNGLVGTVRKIDSGTLLPTAAPAITVIARGAR